MTLQCAPTSKSVTRSGVTLFNNHAWRWIGGCSIGVECSGRCCCQPWCRVVRLLGPRPVHLSLSRLLRLPREKTQGYIIFLGQTHYSAWDKYTYLNLQKCQPVSFLVSRISRKAICICKHQKFKIISYIITVWLPQSVREAKQVPRSKCRGRIHYDKQTKLRPRLNLRTPMYLLL